MPQSEQFDVLVLGRGTGGKLIAWRRYQCEHITVRPKSKVDFAIF